jgi:hypothetical protein
MSGQTNSVRRSTIDRIPLHLRPFATEPRRKLPRGVRRALLALAALLLLLLALVSCHESEKPASLADSALVGPRLVSGPVCIEQAVDVSGSMTAFRAQRELAEKELFAFAAKALTTNDLYAEAFFAGSGVVALRPTSLAAIAAPPGVPNGINYNGTELAPAVDALVAARSPARGGQQCAARALVIITDGIIGDEQAKLAASLFKGGYTRVFAVIPVETGWGRPEQLRGGVLDSISVQHLSEPGLTGRVASILADAKPLDVVFGEIIGSLTGQSLSRVDKAK